MKRKNIAIVLFVISFIILSYGIYLLFTNETQMKNDLPLTYVKEVYNNLTFSGFSVENIDDTYYFYIEVINNTDKEISPQSISVILFDENSNEIITLDTNITKIKPNSKDKIVFKTKKDILNTYDYKVVRK